MIGFWSIEWRDQIASILGEESQPFLEPPLIEQRRLVHKKSFDLADGDGTGHGADPIPLRPGLPAAGQSSLSARARHASAHSSGARTRASAIRPDLSAGPAPSRARCRTMAARAKWQNHAGSLRGRIRHQGYRTRPVQETR